MIWQQASKRGSSRACRRGGGDDPARSRAREGNPLGGRGADSREATSRMNSRASEAELPLSADCSRHYPCVPNPSVKSYNVTSNRHGECAADSRRPGKGFEAAQSAQRRNTPFPKPCAEVRFLPGAQSGVVFRVMMDRTRICSILSVLGRTRAVRSSMAKPLAHAASGEPGSILTSNVPSSTTGQTSARHDPQHRVGSSVCRWFLQQALQALGLRDRTGAMPCPSGIPD